MHAISTSSCPNFAAPQKNGRPKGTELLVKSPLETAIDKSKVTFEIDLVSGKTVDGAVGWA